MQVSSPFVPPPKRNAMRIQRAVLVALVIRELRTRVEGRWLSLLWMLLEPLAHVMLMMALFGFRSHVASANIEYPVFLTTGLLPYFMFRNLARRLPNAVTSNLGLYAYRQVKPIDALAARAVVEIWLSSAVYLAALLLLGWLGYHWWPVEPLALAVVSGVLLALGVGLGLLFSVLEHNRPRVRALVNLVFTPLYLLSGVIIPLHSLSAAWRDWLLLNPVLHLIELSRECFIPYYQVFPGVSLYYPAAFALVTVALALLLYRINRHRLVSVD
jgi:capsular polysaccharide transport system permease protein